jgi:hypothetical protein
LPVVSLIVSELENKTPPKAKKEPASVEPNGTVCNLIEISRLLKTVHMGLRRLIIEQTKEVCIL